MKTPDHESISKRSARRNKAIGTMLVIFSSPYLMWHYYAETDPNGWSIAALLGGFAIFIVGRIQE